MPWDSDKTTDSDLTASEWNSHVVDQKSRAKHYIQKTEPSSPSEGDFWSIVADSFGDILWKSSHIPNDMDQSGTMVYVALDNGWTIALDINNNGSTVWDNTLHSDNVVAVHEANGTLYTLGDTDTVIAMDASDGTELYRTTLNVYTNSMYGTSDTIYIGGYDKDSFSPSVVALNSSDGSQDWREVYGTTDNRAVAIYHDNGVVYYGDKNTGTITAVSDTTGSKNWEHSLHNATDIAAITVKNGIVYSVGDDVIAYDSNTDTELWRVSGGYNDIKILNNRIYLAGAGDTSDNGLVTVVDIDTGEIVWEDQPLTGYLYSISVSDSTLYLTSDNYVYSASIKDAYTQKIRYNGSWIDPKD
jgi:outer membrane protein assembly factor BamB